MYKSIVIAVNYHTDNLIIIEKSQYKE